MVGNVVVGFHVRLLPSGKHVICAPCQSLRYYQSFSLCMSTSNISRVEVTPNDVYHTWSTLVYKIRSGLVHQHEIFMIQQTLQNVDISYAFIRYHLQEDTTVWLYVSPNTFGFGFFCLGPPIQNLPFFKILLAWLNLRRRIV